MIMKRYENKGFVLDELSLYNISMHKEKAPTHTSLSATDGSGVQYDGAHSSYKVKALVHSTQDGDRKLLGLGAGSWRRVERGGGLPWMPAWQRGLWSGAWPGLRS